MAISRNLFHRGLKGSEENVEFAATVNEQVTVGSILSFITDGLFGQVRKARVATNQVVGIAQAKAKQGARVNVIQHGLTKVLMDSAPAKSDNGKPIYLSQSQNGVASLTAPTNSNSYVVRIGYLYGANGVTTTPDVVPSIVFIVFIG